MSKYVSLEWFSKRMERKLRANSHKGGWSGMTFGELRHRIQDELDELDGALELWISVADEQKEGDVSNECLEDLIDECADIANFAMMLADNARNSMK